jgi:hypothetical protein
MSCTTRFLMACLLVLSACSDPDTSPVTPVEDADTSADAPEPDAANNGNNGADVPEPDVSDVSDDPDVPDVPDEPDLPEDGGNNGEASCSRDADCGDGAVFCRIDIGLCDDPNARGVCTPRPRACPGALEPVCGCDGRTQRNECQASQAGISLRRVGACPDDPVQCGRNEECPEGAFCECESDDACAPSVCVAMPEGCDDVSEPVCGCDGVTYDNDCGRQAAGTCKVSDGPCPPQSCGGIQGLTCPEGQSCDIIAGACGTDDAPGTCADLHDDCEGLDAGPVCGCNGTTYPGDCSRLRAGVAKEHDGECPDLGCMGSDDCSPREFCDLPDGCTEGEIGVCEVAPQDCTGEPEDRVCGCDERNYENDCQRRQAGVGKLHNGRCDAQSCGPRLECSRNREFCELSWCIDPDSTGLCVERPRSCREPLEGEEVCGCDGTTFGSDCARRLAGVPLFSEGECDVCNVNNTCRRGAFCEYAGGVCGEGRSSGLCAVVPVACPRNVDPVCGCNGTTYTNDCTRRRDGVALDHTGGCRR